MTILTIIGTRPELIRLSVIIKKLDELYGNQHILVWTGQNHSPKLSDLFFSELNIRQPDYYHKGSNRTFAQQLTDIFLLVEHVIQKHKPNKALILGDTNSALSAIICERYNIPVYHMEAGNRGFDESVPEEKNRKLIDSISSYNLPYVQNSKQNLLNENFPLHRICIVGNPIFEVLNYYQKQINNSNKHPTNKKYAVCTIHRAENVDSKKQIQEILNGISKLDMDVIFPIHPRSQQKFKEFNLAIPSNIQIIEPLGFFDFVQLEKHSTIALTDSGTVQEECCLFNVPTVTIRNTTERPETVECGSNVVSTINADKINEYIQIMLSRSKTWKYPDGYTEPSVSHNVINFMEST